MTLFKSWTLPLAFASLGAVALAQPPADCSKLSAGPKDPAMVAVNGVTFIAKSALLAKIGGMSGEIPRDTIELKLKSDNDFFSEREMSVAVTVPKGQRVDGRTFLMRPTNEMAKQVVAEPGLPEIQGFVFKDKANRWSHVEYVASVRVEFGKRNEETITGNICVVIPRGQRSSFSPAEKPLEKENYAFGTFQATLQPSVK
jgi:hypothetical protein